MIPEDALLVAARGVRDHEPLEEGRLLDALQQRMFGQPPTPVRVGRFVLLEMVGEGGMGRVYSAYDPKLERKVALKLLRGSLASQPRSRMLREAKALARLAHPNVVAVFEVGAAEGLEFIAMEFVEGTNLRRWLDEDHPWQERLAALRDAGRGLAAAHRAGLIHRDFKPENVLVDPEGRVRVVDFGLARVEAELAAPTETGATSDGESETARAGTPAYMAPEQVAGDDVDARADQYAYCVTLYEALHGRRPSGQDSTPRGSGAWPARLDDAIARGLSEHHRERFSSMDALLAELSVDERPRRRKLATVALVGVAAVAVFALARTRPAAACDRIGDRGRDRIDDIVAQPATSGFSRAVRDYEQRWEDARAVSCGAPSTSEVVRELTVRCLEDRRVEANALLGLVTDDPNAKPIDAESAVRNLPTPQRCLETERLLQREGSRVGGSPEALLSAREVLADARARVWIEDASAQIEVLDALLERPVVRDDAVLRAEAQRLLSAAMARTGDLTEARRGYARAFASAEAGGDVRQRVEIALDLAVHVGHRLAQPDSGMDWVEIADAFVGEQSTSLRSDVEAARGRVLYTAGRYDDAEEAHRRALQWLSSSDDAEPTDVAAQKVRLGGTLIESGKHAEAETLLREAVDTYLALGVEGGRAAVAYNNLSNAQTARGEFTEAAESARRALSFYEGVRPLDHPDIAMASNNLAIALASLGSFVESIEYFERAEVAWRRRYGPDHPKVAVAQVNLATALYMVDRWQEALDVGDRALETQRKTQRPHHPDIALSLRARARALLKLTRAEEAIVALIEAEAIVLEELGAEHLQTSMTRFEAALALLEVDRAREALARLDDACPRLREASGSEVQRGDCTFAWGRAAWLSGDQDRGRTLLEEAESLFSNSEGEWSSIRRGVVREWINLHVDSDAPAPPSR